MGDTGEGANQSESGELIDTILKNPIERRRRWENSMAKSD